MTDINLNETPVTIQDIIANNAPVFILQHAPSDYDYSHNVHCKRIASALYHPNGELKSLMLVGALSNGTQVKAGDDVTLCNEQTKIYATEEDLINDRPVNISQVNPKWLAQKYDLHRPYYYIDRDKEIDTEKFIHVVEHINIVTGEIILNNYRMGNRYRSEEELKENNPDLFPAPKVKIRITKVIETETDSVENAEGIIRDAENGHYGELFTDTITIRGEIVED